MTRQEHLDWCKQRAYQYLDIGDVQNAFASFASDVAKHKETAAISGIITGLSMPLMLMGQLSTVAQMREHIAGFN